MRYSEQLEVNRIIKYYQERLLFLNQELIYRDKHIRNLERTIELLKIQLASKGGKHDKKTV